MKRFLIQTTTLSIILILLKYLLVATIFPKAQIPLFILIVLFFFLSTNFVYYRLLNIASKNMRKFNPTFLGMGMIKMFIYLILALVYVWFYREFAKEFLISFFILYVSFSVLEVAAMLRLVKRKN